MAKESDVPVPPITPRKPNEQSHRAVNSHHPEFGKPSPIGPVQHHRHPQQQQQKNYNNNNSSNPFNIPKANRPRAEHHRPHPQSRHQNYPPPPGGGGGARPPFGTPHAEAAVSTPKRGPAFDPFKPVRPSAYNNNRFSKPVDNDVVEIRRPENVTFGTPRAPKTLFASNPSAVKPSNANKNLQRFADLTGEGGFTPSAPSRHVGFGSMDANGFVDTAKANENIKALLEGAFEDEDEKRQPKGKKNKKNRKNRGKQKKDKVKEKEGKQKEEETLPVNSDKEVEDELDGLAAQFRSVTVGDPNAAGDDKKPASKEDVTDDVEGDSGLPDDKAGEDQSEDDDEEDEEEDDGTVEGLKVKLLQHQREGVRWMCDKETGRNRGKGVLPKGGILADDMGLGKTVQAIALMLTNRKPESGIRYTGPKEDDDEDASDDDEDAANRKLPPGVSKSTLVIAPLALIKQWEAEIGDKVESSHKLRVLVYHGNTRAKATDRLEDYDVVITTYGTLTSEHGAVDKGNKKSSLFSTYWYRIILDEAHTIKNRNAKATQAAYALDAEYRWCLSGTPMQNNLDELQSLIRFLRIKPFNDLAAWKEQITKPLANGRGGLAIQRLQVYLKAFMKRRTKDVLKLDDSLKAGEKDSDGQPKKSSGFQITKREVIKVKAEFMPGEMNFYQRLEQRTENSLEKLMGGAKVDYAGALVLLLRLRQACNHPDLVKSDLAKDKDVLLQNGALGNQPAPAKPDDLDSMADLFGGLSVVTKKCDICQTELSKEEASGGGSRCRECETDLNVDFTSAQKPKKKAPRDIVDLTDSPSANRSSAKMARARRNRKVVLDSDDEEEDDGEWIVPEDQRTATNLGKAGGSDDEDAEGGGEWLNSDDSDSDDDSGPESPTQQRKASKIRDSRSDTDDDIYIDSGAGKEQILPSTKIRHLMKVLKSEASDHKFIVFSVFTSMLDKIEPFLTRAGIGFARYDGSMRNDHREASLNRLRNNSATRVLLCSLRAGALGLNLTAASRVVILEPFWNPVCFTLLCCPKLNAQTLTSLPVRRRASNRPRPPPQPNRRRQNLQDDRQRHRRRAHSRPARPQARARQRHHRGQIRRRQAHHERHDGAVRTGRRVAVHRRARQYRPYADDATAELEQRRVDCSAGGIVCVSGQEPPA